MTGISSGQEKWKLLLTEKHVSLCHHCSEVHCCMNASSELGNLHQQDVMLNRLHWQRARKIMGWGSGYCISTSLKQKCRPLDLNKVDVPFPLYWLL